MIEAIVLVRVGSSETFNFMKTIKEEMRRVKGVKDIQGVFGRYDFVVKVETETLEELGKLVTDNIRGLKGVTATETLVIGF
jgi:DNA-binding Lrp family transcriptional regulator